MGKSEILHWPVPGLPSRFKLTPTRHPRSPDFQFLGSFQPQHGGTHGASNRAAEGDVEVASQERILLPGLSAFRWVPVGSVAGKADVQDLGVNGRFRL